MVHSICEYSRKTAGILTTMSVVETATVLHRMQSSHKLCAWCILYCASSLLICVIGTNLKFSEHSFRIQKNEKCKILVSICDFMIATSIATNFSLEVKQFRWRNVSIWKSMSRIQMDSFPNFDDGNFSVDEWVVAMKHSFICIRIEDLVAHRTWLGRIRMKYVPRIDYKVMMLI